MASVWKALAPVDSTNETEGTYETGKQLYSH